MIPSTVKTLVDKASLKFVQWPLFNRAVTFLSYQQKRTMRRRLERQLRASGAYGDEVQRGPFAGIKLPPGWISCRFEKTIGAYEAELHPLLEKLAATKDYTDIVNVGSAEGLYTVGMMRLFPQARATSFEIKEEGRAYCRELAKANGAADRLDLRATCHLKDLAALQLGERPLLLMDVDGAELDLFDSDQVPWIRRADILIELHDCFIPGLSDTLLPRIQRTHSTRIITNCGLAYADYPILRKLTFAEIYALTSEDRPALQDWVFGEPL